MQWRKPTLGSTPGGSALTTLALFAVLLTGCMTSTGTGGTSSSQPDISDQIREVDLTPPPRQHVATGGVTTNSKSGGAPRPTTATAVRRLQTPNLALSLTPLQPVRSPTAPRPVEAIKAMKSISRTRRSQRWPKPFWVTFWASATQSTPACKGTVSLSSGRAVPKKDLLYVLESALRMSDVALVRDGARYRLIPTAEAVAAGSTDWARDPSAGYGISVIPLQFVSAQTLIKLLDNYAAKPGTVRAEPSRNLISSRETAPTAALPSRRC